MSRLLLACAVVLALLAGPSAAAACSGTALIGDDTTDPNADVIFTGTAVRREDVGLFRFGGNLFEPVRWTFVVDGVEKGSAERRMTIESEKYDGSCGFPFRLGYRYRVVASDGGFGLQAWSHNGTGQLEPSATPRSSRATVSASIHGSSACSAAPRYWRW